MTIQVNNDTLANAMRSIINNRITIDWHVPDPPPDNLNSSACLDHDDDVHVMVNGKGVNISKFIEQEAFWNDDNYGKNLLQAVAGINAARKVLDEGVQTT